MSSPLSTAMFIVYNIESIPSNVSRVVSTKYLHCGEKNALHCKNVYVWRFLCLCPCITVWVEKGHYLAKKVSCKFVVFLMKDVSRGLMQCVLCRGSTRPVTARRFLPLYTARGPSLRTVCATQSHDPR